MEIKGERPTLRAEFPRVLTAETEASAALIDGSG